jgi:hypothetical protein
MLQAYVSNVSSVFQTYVASVFIWMLHMFYTYVARFYLDVAYVCNGFKCFCKCFQTHVSSVSFILHLNVLKVDGVLHLPPHLLLPRLVSPPPPGTGWAPDTTP